MNHKSHLKFYVRPALAIAFAFVGVFIAKLSLPSEVDGASRLIILSVAGIAFALLGFVLPELVEFFGRAGITAIAMQIMRELPKEAANIPRPQFSFGPRREDGPTEFKSPIVIDTSILIDGRIVDVAKTGFLSGQLLIMPSVITELHMLADSTDSLKRAKGRRGLDGLAELKKVRGIDLVLLEVDPVGAGVDEKLLVLARKLHARIMTNDFNLNKVAKVKGVQVLNLNELTNAVKSKVLPGEDIEIDIKAVGKSKDQGVGYLEDGTMVVVEGGAKLKGKSLTVRVMKVLQTAAGRMVFSKPKGE
jgi:uncharacterized protein YacL